MIERADGDEYVETEIGAVEFGPDFCICVLVVAKIPRVVPDVRILTVSGRGAVEVDLDLDDTRQLHQLLGLAIESASKEEQ